MFFHYIFKIKCNNSGLLEYDILTKLLLFVLSCGYISTELCNEGFLISCDRGKKKRKTEDRHLTHNRFTHEKVSIFDASSKLKEINTHTKS